MTYRHLIFGRKFLLSSIQKKEHVITYNTMQFFPYCSFLEARTHVL